MLEHFKLRFINVVLFQGRCKFDGWLIERLISQYESSPVHCDGILRPNVYMYSCRFIRIDMVGFHEPSWFVGADRQQRKFELAIFVADLLEVIRIAGIPRKKDPIAVSLDHP